MANKLNQVKQLLRNSLLSENSKLDLIRAVVENDGGDLTSKEAKRLVLVNRNFATCYRVGLPLDRLDRQLANRGLVGMRLVNLEKRVFVTARGQRALAAKKAVS